MNAAGRQGPQSILAGIGILLSPELAHNLADIAAQVCANAETDFSIGREAPPHVTLLHAHCGPGGELEWWRLCRQRIGSQFTAEILELATSQIPDGDYHSPGGGTYVGLNLVRDELLEAAHRTILETAVEVGAVPRGLFGAKYHPHITLAVLQAPVAISPKILRRVSSMPLAGYLALASVGAHGKFADILQVAR
jgi:2'-5' RNA ligase